MLINALKLLVTMVWFSAIDGCPLGYICDEDTKYKTSCSEIREVPIDFAFGDYFGGVYCPAGIDHMRNCPKGYYCPTPAEKYPCPEVRENCSISSKIVTGPSIFHA
jgi:hypothetical protein